MTKIAHSTIVNAPVEKVFEYASDWSKWEEWFVGVYNFEPISEIKKGNGLKIRYEAKMMMFKSKVEAEIYDYVENEGFKGVGIKGMPYTSFWSFEEMEGTTKFTYGLEYSLSTPVIGPVLNSLFVKPQWDKIVRVSVQNLSKKFSQ